MRLIGEESLDQEGRDRARLQDLGRLVLGQETCRALLEELETDAGGVREGALSLQWLGLGLVDVLHTIRQHCRTRR